MSRAGTGVTPRYLNLLKISVLCCSDLGGCVWCLWDRERRKVLNLAVFAAGLALCTGKASGHVPPMLMEEDILIAIV